MIPKFGAPISSLRTILTGGTTAGDSRPAVRECGCGCGGGTAVRVRACDVTAAGAADLDHSGRTTSSIEGWLSDGYPARPVRARRRK